MSVLPRVDLHHVSGTLPELRGVYKTYGIFYEGKSAGFQLLSDSKRAIMDELMYRFRLASGNTDEALREGRNSSLPLPLLEWSV
jgi:hypothetical protein